MSDHWFAVFAADGRSEASVVLVEGAPGILQVAACAVYLRGR